MKNPKYTLFDEFDNLIASFSQFDQQAIKTAIVSHLSSKPVSLVDYRINGAYVAFYENHPTTGAPCKIISKGNREFYQPITV